MGNEWYCWAREKTSGRVTVAKFRDSDHLGDPVWVVFDSPGPAPDDACFSEIDFAAAYDVLGPVSPPGDLRS